MNYHPKGLLFILTTLLILTSCSSSKQVAYFQYNTADTLKNNPVSRINETLIKPKDQLSISVVASNQEATKEYNLQTPQLSSATLGNTANSQFVNQSYLVENDGTINFPTLGRLHVAGLTRRGLETMIMNRIRPAFNNEHPIITINILNYSVNVLGEVNSPGKFTVSNERITILDAIAQAGDLKIYGKRDNIKVLREHADGSKEYLQVNLNDQNIVNSPAYYLEQNDIVYVEPNNVQKRSSSIGSAETVSLSLVSTFISIASLIINVLR